MFFVCVSNVDDHLRNHGFLLERDGWKLAPAYDMNPVATGDGLTLNISETDNAQDLGLVREVAKRFRIKPKRAEEIIGEVVKVVRGWPRAATSGGISRSEQEQMADAFRIADRGNMALMSKIKSPPQKKRASLAHDRRNAYGENSKASRKNIARGKTRTERAYRHSVKGAVHDAVKVGTPEDAVLEDSVVRAERKLADAREKRKDGFHKTPDIPLKDAITRKLARRKPRAK